MLNGTNVTSIDAFNHYSSLDPLWMQVEAIVPKFKDLMAEYKEGINLVCFSQG